MSEKQKGRDPLMAIRLPQELLDQIDALATSMDRTRSWTVRYLIRTGLETLESPTSSPPNTYQRGRPLGFVSLMDPRGLPAIDTRSKELALPEG